MNFYAKLESDTVQKFGDLGMPNIEAGQEELITYD